MKLGIVEYPESINMGDEVQSIAAQRLLPKVDTYVPREQMDSFQSDEKVKLICNGWFMDKPMNWPPSDDIDPLFISLHITNSNKSHKLMPHPKLVEYYKKHEPIGCRDLATKRMFDKIGVKAYFSSCLTLTLDNPYSEAERGDRILLVDPFRTNYTESYRNHMMDQLVPEKYKDKVDIIKQRSTRDRSREQRFKMAEDLIDQYAKAKLVITSRIHCALPCLALGTPVYFVNAGYDAWFTLNDRFEGLIELFHVIEEDHFPYGSSSIKDKIARRLGSFKNKKIKPLDIDWENPSPNPVDITPIANELRKTVSEFIAQ